jgi:outer membrane usher protein
MSLIWTLPLGANHSTSATRNSTRSSTQGNARELIFTAQKNLPVGEGHGYQIEARESGDLRGAATYQNNVATFTAEAASVQGESAMRAGIRGGVALVGGQPYLSRWISESFGLARVPGFADVRVYADNHLVGQTDAAGDAMLPRLRAYERNRIRIEPRDLPLDADVDTLRVEAVPYFRSGVVAEFPVRRSRGALFRVLLDDGQPLPAGTTVERRGGKSIFPVANDGEVYVTGLEAQNRMIARWKNQACEFDLKFEPTADPLPDLGSHLCKGIAP